MKIDKETVGPAASDLSEDQEILLSMGYSQELHRGMRTFQNFAMSFSIICILAGGVNSFGQGLSSVGGAAIGIGWPLATGISCLFALAMGQIGSAFPTAGGLYHWGSILGGRALGWVTAWCNLLGLIAVLASVNVGAYLFFIGSVLPGFGVDTSALTPATPTPHSILVQTVAVVVITVSQALFNHLGIKLTSKLTDLSGYLIFFTAAALTVLLLVFAHRIDLPRLWTFHNYSGEAGGGVWPKSNHMSYLFMLGLLLPAYTITGFDASAHTAEETINPSSAIPKGMVHSVLWSGIFGYVLLATIVLVAPNLDMAAKQGANSFGWIMGQTAPAVPRLGLFVLIAASQYLCGLATVTSTSRMAFAFARDGGLPWSKRLSFVNPRFQTPATSIWVVALGSVALTVYTPVYTALAAMCAILIYVSYALPIGAAFFAFRRSWHPRGSFTLGWWFRPISAACVASAIVLIYIGIQPPNDIAINVLVGAGILALLVWFGLERKRFKGPRVKTEV